ncbi:MAG: hypothetical protein HN826_02980 [Methylococcales bacterium]|jgi:spermidine synthase|nr:hypothetical protein [Methylococcales bacterium]
MNKSTLKKYNGIVLKQALDQHGSIEVVETQLFRQLHFGNKTIQSRQFIDNPLLLIDQYTQMMLLPLAWQKPKRVLILGLGGGSLVKFILHHLNNVAVDVIEMRQGVIDFAYQYFNLKPDARLNIFTMPAECFLTESTENQYDLILMDLFLTKNTENICVTCQDQYFQLSQRLTKNGCLSMNILGRHIDDAWTKQLRRFFPGFQYIIPTRNLNSVMIASKSAFPCLDFHSVRESEEKFGLSFLEYLLDLGDLNIKV